jgi:hypothetical protein
MNLTTLTALPAEPLLQRQGIHQRLSGAGLAALRTVFSDLVEDQDARLAVSAEPSRIPLLWRGLAEVVGLVIDNDGRIIDGPRSQVPGL